MNFEQIVSEVRSELWKRNIPIVNCEVVISKRLKKAFGNTRMKEYKGERDIYKEELENYERSNDGYLAAFSDVYNAVAEMMQPPELQGHKSRL